ncbi:MAG: hypothetical protein WC378_10520 [Opitutaceae bacterium]|jgi:hypothetical protein
MKVRVVHPYQWLWEPLEGDAGFLLKPMFGGKAAYIDGKLVLYFSAKQEPWRGVFACTDRAHHASLMAEYPELKPHSVLSKWLYLSESSDRFESVAERLVRLARKRDSRLGVEPKPKKKRGTAKPQMPEVRIRKPDGNPFGRLPPAIGYGGHGRAGEKR